MSASDFARAAGLTPTDISRIVSPGSSRRATRRQLRAIAAALERSYVDVAKHIVPDDPDEIEPYEEIVRDRDALVSDLASARKSLLDHQARLASAERTIGELSAAANKHAREIENLTDALQRQKSRATACAELAVQRRGELVESRRSCDVARERLERTRAEAALRLAEVVEQLRALESSSTRQEVRSIERQILAGALGAAVGAVIATGGEKRTKRKRHTYGAAR